MFLYIVSTRMYVFMYMDMSQVNMEITFISLNTIVFTAFDRFTI